MKSIKLALVTLVIMLGYGSCDQSILNTSPPTLTEAGYFSTEEQFEKTVLGVYAKLTDFYWYAGGAGNTLNTINVLPGDDITTTALEEFEAFSTLQPGSSRLNNFYSSAYQLINRAIILLDANAAVKSGVYVTPNLQKYHRGEGLFLRAYAYYLLWNTFGTAPLVTTRVTDISQTKPASSKGTELLDQAITDLTEAATLLPSSWDAANLGRVTANSANGLLGKCLVFRATVSKNASDYTSALNAFNQISGLTLTSKFDDNFAFDTENNAESLFEFQASQPSFDNVWLSNDVDYAVGSLSVYWGFFNGSFAQFGKPNFIATQKLASLYESGDPRADSTLDAVSLAFKKYVTRDHLSQSGVGSVNNPRILRYADVLLLMAEALNESGGSTSQAIGLINQVRARARGAGSVPADRSTAETDKTVIRQWIMDERLLELAGEGQRWFDLRRWHIAGFITLDNNFFGSADPADMGFQTKHLYWPIPSSEVLKNPNITQNTGY